MIALLTGSAGFVGRHMWRELHERGWDVIGLDIKDGNDALDLFRTGRTRYDLVVHAAASSPHRAAIDGEPQHFARNLQLDAAMFDWAVRTQQRRVLYLSSSAAYPVRLQRNGGRRYILAEEDIDPYDPGTPDAVYGWTKLTGERLAIEARKAGVPVTVVRPFSGYGEDQSEDFPFRALIERARSRVDPFIVWGSGDQVRDWIHIDDVVKGALAVVESGTEGPVNLCTGTGFSMAELAHLACDAVGHKPRFEYLTDRPAGVDYRVGNPAEFHRYHLPKISLPMGVDRALKG
jgi:nucleoside-diphosphate-sugar epimerase